MTELKVPSVAESITEVTLARYLVKDGDYVEMDQMVCELHRMKAVNAILHLQFIDALRLIEAPPAQSQARLGRERIKSAQPRTPLLTVSRAIVRLSVDPYTALERPVIVQVRTNVPVSKCFVSLRIWG